MFTLIPEAYTCVLTNLNSNIAVATGDMISRVVPITGPKWLFLLTYVKMCLVYC